MSDSFVTPWTVTHWVILSVGFPRQEYWSRLPSPSPGDLPNPGIETVSPAWPAPGKFKVCRLYSLYPALYPCHEILTAFLFHECMKSIVSLSITPGRDSSDYHTTLLTFQPFYSLLIGPEVGI